MFTEWIVFGTALGIKAFFAVFVFLLCVGIVFGMLAAIGAMFKGDNR